MAWITAISLASFFWFLASNSNLDSSGGEGKGDEALHAFILAGQTIFFNFFLPVFDYSLYYGICGEVVPAVHNTQDSSPPRLLDINKTALNENHSDYSHPSVGGGGVLTAYGSDPSLPGYISVLP